MSEPSSLTPPASNSRSSSPGLTPGPAESKPRVVSGSLKDRIAKFNNPSAAPLIPTHAFGTAGPTGSSHITQRGLVGNRIPTLDPKTAAMVGGSRKVSETKGLIGNRIPSTSVPVPRTSASTGPGSIRSASPAGSVDSSTASGKPDSSASPNTSRSSSPPTSPGGGLPPSLLAATLPDTGGPGASTPSSTMADAGDEISHLSTPTTPIAAPELPPPGYDLNPGNLKLNSAVNPTLLSLAAEGSGLTSFAPSISSSLASQYDPSRASDDQTKMMADVSGISTPMGTPKAANRDLEGSVAGGSVRGEGSVADMDDLRGRLEGLSTESELPETETGNQHHHHHHDPNEDSDLEALKEGRLSAGPDDMEEPETPREERPEPQIDAEDPNKASDLQALKEGRLSSGPARPGTHTVDQNPINNIVEAAFAQNVSEHIIPPEEKKEQGGEAGTRIEEYETPDEVISPMESPPGNPNDEDPVVREVTPHGEGKDGGHTKGSSAFFASEGTRLAKGKEDGAGATAAESKDTERPEVETPSLADTSSGDGPEITEVDEVEGEGETAGHGKATENAASTKGNEESTEDRPTGEAPHVLADPSTATTQVGTDAQKPMQVHIEPAPIAQPENDHEPSDTISSRAGASTLSASHDTSASSETEINPSAFPSAPTVDPDVVDPPHPSSTIDQDLSGTSTPLDPSLMRSFPDVPDEDKPRVEVHVSSPLNTPSKPKVDDPATAHSTPDQAAPQTPSTPLANIPGHSKSLTNPPDPAHVSDEETDRSPGVEGGEHEQQHATPRRDQKQIQTHTQARAQTPTGRSSSDSGSARSDSGQSLNLNVNDGNANTPRVQKRLSTRKSPKSPLLDDEDPGDFEPGEGWAVVTKGRDA